MDKQQAAVNWKSGEKLSIADAAGTHSEFTVREQLEEGLNVFDAQGRSRFYAHAELRRMFVTGALRRVRATGRGKGPKNLRLEGSLCALPEARRAEARRVGTYVTEWVRRGEKWRASKTHLESIIKDVAAQIGDKKGMSWRSLSDKLRHVKDGRFDLRTMVGNVEGRGNRTKRFKGFEQVIADEIREHILVPVPMTTKDLLMKLWAALKVWNDEREGKPDEQVGLKLDVSTLQRRIAAISAYDKAVAWEGSRAAARRFRPVGKAPPARFPMDVIEIDHTPIDAYAVHPETGQPMGRPILTVAVDRYSRMLVGWHIGFEEPSYKTVMLCVMAAIMPKDEMLLAYGLDPDSYPVYGLFCTAVFDNGKEFHGAPLDDALGQLGVDKRYCRTAMGEDKGMAEAFNGTANCLTHSWPGTTFMKSDNKNQDKDLRDPQAEACLTVADMRRLFARWAVLEYAHTEHRGIGDNTPIGKLLEGTRKHPLCMPDDVADLAILLLPAETRVLQREGIAMFGVYYGTRHPLLAALLRDPGLPEECVIKFDPNDLGSVHLLDWRTQKYIALAAPVDSGLQGKTHREYKVDREIALANQKEREALHSGHLMEAAETRRKTVEALKKEDAERRKGKNRGKGRAFARMAGADPEFPSTGPVPEAVPAPVAAKAVPPPQPSRSRARPAIDFSVH